MKKTIIIAGLVLAFLINLSYNSFSQSSSISGTVTDSVTDATLPFANVLVKGTTLGTSTNLNGEYRLPVREGLTTIVVSYMGYESMEKEVNIAPGENVTLNFALEPQSILGEEIIISAMMRGQKSAISNQLNAAGIVNSVAEEQIQELPDANAGEALGRLPGISLKRSGGEAQSIVLRGLNEGFSMIQLDGVAIPPTGSSSRGVDLSLFSINSLAGIEVTKALTPDMDADAIAGTVNLVTKKAAPEPELRIDVGGGYNVLESSGSQYNFGLRYNNRLFSDFLGLQASLTTEKKIRSSEGYGLGWNIRPDSSYVITALNPSYIDETRTRTGANLLLDIKTPDGGAIRLNNFWNRTDRDAVNYNRDYPVNGNVSYGIRDTEREIHSLNNSLAGENFLGNININWGISHALTIGKTLYDHDMTFQEGGAAGSGMMNVPQEDQKGPGEILMDYAYNNWPLAYINRAFWRPGENKDRDLAAYLDLERAFNLTDNINVTLKAGTKYRFKDRKNILEVYRAPYWVNRPKNFIQLDDGSIVPADFSNTSFADPIMVGGSNISMLNFLTENPPSRGIFDDRYVVNPLLDADLMREWYEIHKNGISEDGSLREYARFSDGIEDNYSVTERISSGYAMATLNFGRMIRLLGGVRVEKEKNDYTAKYAPEVSGFFTYDPTTVSDTMTSYTETYVLPNFHIRFKPFDWFDLRFAATKTLARPNFTMRLPTLVVERTRQSVDRGNSDLKTTEAWNYDLIGSFYDSKYGLFTVGVFQKKLDNIFYNLSGIRILNVDMEADLGLPTGYGNYIGYTLSEPVNTQGSEVKGIEFDLQANLSFLPGFLGNFVFRGNYTVLKSVTYIPRFKFNVDNSTFPPKNIPEFYETKERLEGQPSNFGNLALGYDMGGFSGRLSVFFQDDYPTSVTSSGLGDTFQKGYSKWDLALKQEIKKYRTEIMLNIVNITNMYEGTYYKYRSLDRGSRRYDMLIDLGLRFTL